MKSERDNEPCELAGSESELTSILNAEKEVSPAETASTEADEAPLSALDRLRALVASNREARVKSKSKAKASPAPSAAPPAASSDVLDRVRALVEREREARLRREAEPATEAATAAEATVSRARRGSGPTIGGACPQLPPSKLWFRKGEDLVARRKELGLNQTEFWSRVRVTHASGGLYERGRKMPEGVKLLLQIAYGSDAQSAEAVEVLRLPGQERAAASAPEPARKKTRQKWGMLP